MEEGRGRGEEEGEWCSVEERERTEGVVGAGGRRVAPESLFAPGASRFRV